MNILCFEYYNATNTTFLSNVGDMFRKINCSLKVVVLETYLVEWREYLILVLFNQLEKLKKYYNVHDSRVYMYLSHDKSEIDTL